MASRERRGKAPRATTNRREPPSPSPSSVTPGKLPFFVKFSFLNFKTVLKTDSKHFYDLILRYKIRIQGLKESVFSGVVFRLVFRPERTVTYRNPRFSLLKVINNIKQVYIINLWYFWWLFMDEI